MHPKSQLCERARAWASLRTDGELSELESALLDAHLGRCEPCRAFAEGTQNVAAALRSVRFVRPAPLVLVPDHHGRRNGIRALRLATAAAAIVAVGIAGALSGPSSGGAAAAKPVSMVASVDSPDRLRELRRPGLVEQGRSTIPRNRQEPGEPV